MGDATSYLTNKLFTLYWLILVFMEKAVDMPVAEVEKDKSQFVKNSVLYKEFLAEREEILKHKWIESEKAGKDIGFEKALLDWIVKHRSHWRERRMKEARTEKAAS